MSRTDPAAQPEVFKCGTLTYTKAALVTLFIWLLWGDFCFTLMETVVPSIVPLHLKGLNCPNWLIGLILSTIPNLMNMTVSPYISVRSDRCRSRWGRRIPFIATSIPFLFVSLVMIGCSHDISAWMSRTVPLLKDVAPGAVTVGLIAVLMVLFQFFNQFVNSTFNYLFNDVVPQSHIGRFAGAFRIVGTAVSALYNFFIFRYAESHSREIFLGAAVLYAVGFGLMCFMVKEGEYPPLDESQEKKASRWENLRTFFRESFHEPFYRLLFISAGILAFAGVAWSFQVFFLLEMKMDLRQIGLYNGILMLAGMVATFFAATFVDRWHPLRAYTYGVIFTITGPVMNWVWLFIDLPGHIFFYLSLSAQLLYAFMNALSSACAMPITMRLFPHSRYGQFCSARGIVYSICTILGGFLVGGFYDVVKSLSTAYLSAYPIVGPGYCYRLYFVWAGGATLLNFIVISLAYRRWLKLGGDANFHPPAPWTKEGFEHIPIVATTGYSSRWLKRALHFMDFVQYGSLVMAVVMLWPFHVHGMKSANFWFLTAVIPLSIGVSFLWYLLSRRIRQDIAAAKRGEMPKYGIPHHGMMMVFGVKFSLTLGLVVAQFVVSIHLENSLYATLFALGNIVTNLLLILCTYVVIRMERGYSTKVDEASMIQAGVN